MSKKIKLTKGLYAIVDDRDCDYLNQWKWHTTYKMRNGAPYASRSVQRSSDRGSVRQVYMHRIILGVAFDDFIVDHINHDTLDNRKENLRITDSQGNSRNQSVQRKNPSGYKGVSWSANTKSWRARISIRRKEIPLGRYKDPIEAAKAYDVAAKKYFGEFAYLNFK